MQIRIGNKQDEPPVRSLVEELHKEIGRGLDLSGIDADLNRIESHYFGHDGIFLVAEDERIIVGFAAAVKSSETECQLRRLYVRPQKGRQGIGNTLLDKMIAFAKGLDYKVLFVPQTSILHAGGREFLTKRGFVKKFDRYSLNLNDSET